MKLTYCSNCLNTSTRPRISFDERGWCNACQWMEQKKKIDWGSRQEELHRLLDRYRSKNGEFDCLVPVSGGKDGSYVAYQLKHVYGMNPLTVTVRPPLSLEIGEKNLNNFLESGYSHIHISPDPTTMQQFNKYGFIEKGSPYFGWLTTISSAVIRTALNYGIPLVFYGEDGEVEYGGSSQSKDKALYDINYIKKIYLEGGHDQILSMFKNINESSLYFWKYPNEKELEGRNLFLSHWSYYEAWDSYRNYLVAKEHCGLQEMEENASGTFTNFAQNDQSLYSLHTYIMYLKFGFGRATQDAGIEIRRGAMTRDQAVNLVKLYDNHYPEEFILEFLEYFQMTQSEFDKIIDRWANKDLFTKLDGHWQPLFEVS